MRVVLPAGQEEGPVQVEVVSLDLNHRLDLLPALLALHLRHLV